MPDPHEQHSRLREAPCRMGRSNVAQNRVIVEVSAGGSIMRRALNFMRTGVSGLDDDQDSGR
jgi:hypothetical protein